MSANSTVAVPGKQGGFRDDRQGVVRAETPAWAAWRVAGPPRVSRESVNRVPVREEGTL